MSLNQSISCYPTLLRNMTHTHTTTLKEARHGKTQVRIARHAELTVCNSFASLFRFKAYWNGFGIIRPFPSAFCFDYLIFVPEKVN